MVNIEHSSSIDDRVSRYISGDAFSDWVIFEQCLPPIEHFCPIGDRWMNDSPCTFGGGWLGLAFEPDDLTPAQYLYRTDKNEALSDIWTDFTQLWTHVVHRPCPSGNVAPVRSGRLHGSALQARFLAGRAKSDRSGISLRMVADEDARPRPGYDLRVRRLRHAAVVTSRRPWTGRRARLTHALDETIVR